MTDFSSDFTVYRNIPGVDTLVAYRCKTCETKYDTAAEAAKCFAQGWEPQLEPGDIVMPKLELDDRAACYTWISGYGHWATEHTAVKGQKRAFMIHYVVTAVTTAKVLNPHSYPRRGSHEPIYHVATRAFIHNHEPRVRWTSRETHLELVKVQAPHPLVVKEGAKLVGQHATQIL